MRDPKRIDVILDMIETIWRAEPDLRLAQIIMNAYGKPGDPYGYEDNDLLEDLLEIRMLDESETEEQKTVWALKSTSEYSGGFTTDKIYHERPSDEKVMKALKDKYSSDSKYTWEKRGDNTWRAGITTVVLEEVEIE